MRSSRKTMKAVLETARSDLPEALLDKTGYQKIAAIAEQFLGKLHYNRLYERSSGGDKLPLKKGEY